MIKKDYVDDGFGGGSNNDVVWMMGEMRDKEGKIHYQGTVLMIMARGGFNIKIMV